MNRKSCNKLWQNLFPLDHIHFVNFFANSKVSIENFTNLTNFSAVLAKTLCYLKIPHATFKSHSSRIGAATEAFLKGRHKAGGIPMDIHELFGEEVLVLWISRPSMKWCWCWWGAGGSHEPTLIIYIYGSLLFMHLITLATFNDWH